MNTAHFWFGFDCFFGLLALFGFWILHSWEPASISCWFVMVLSLACFAVVVFLRCWSDLAVLFVFIFVVWTCLFYWAGFSLLFLLELSVFGVVLPFLFCVHGGVSVFGLEFWWSWVCVLFWGICFFSSVVFCGGFCVFVLMFWGLGLVGLLLVACYVFDLDLPPA